MNLLLALLTLLASSGMVDVTTLGVKNDGSKDVAARLQKIIDTHPNRTLHFPDGTYLLSRPILTPANPKRSVDLKLERFAILKAATNWTEKAALVRLGGKDPANDIRTVGSNYSLTGGILDGSGVADGVSIDGGRETAIRDVSIKHVRIGVHVKKGANNGSSDADIANVNIVGNEANDSIGLLVEGYDNTFANMRIASVMTGVDVRTGGNIFRDIHPLYTCWKYRDYERSVGFVNRAPNNWYDFCYSDNFAIGFKLYGNGHSQFDRCFVWWYSAFGKQHTAIHAVNRFEATFTDLKVGFKAPSETNVILKEGEKGGKGELIRVRHN